MFSTINYERGTVTFSELKNSEMCLDYIRAPLGLLSIFESTMSKIDRLVLAVAEFHHRAIQSASRRRPDC
jgi:hypothetical protein